MTLSTRLRELLEQDGVTQADRKMAWVFRPEGYGPDDYANWVDGRYDKTRVVQAFRNHRLSDPLRAIMPEVIEALEGMEAEIDDLRDDVAKAQEGIQ